MPNVLIEYRYRDAHGYARHGSWTVVGEPDMAALEATLHEGEFFVPDAVGMPMLTPGGGEWRDDADHPFHTLEDVKATDGPADEDRPFDRLVDAFRRADWAKAGVDHELALS